MLTYKMLLFQFHSDIAENFKTFLSENTFKFNIFEGIPSCPYKTCLANKYFTHIFSGNPTVAISCPDQ